MTPLPGRSTGSVACLVYPQTAVLANCDGLSSPYALGAGKLESSLWARTFLDAFAAGGKPIA